MKTSKAATAIATGSVVLLLSTAAYAAHPKWSLTCDSENKCIYMSDGMGEKQSSEEGYPVAVDIETLQITVKSTDQDEKCVWQWSLIGGKWRWVCVLTPPGAPSAK